MIQLNHGNTQPLQYVANAAFLATLFSDYLDAADTPGWYCGPNFYSTDVLRKFAETQVFFHLCHVSFVIINRVTYIFQKWAHCR